MRRQVHVSLCACISSWITRGTPIFSSNLLQHGKYKERDGGGERKKKTKYPTKLKQNPDGRVYTYLGLNMAKSFPENGIPATSGRRYSRRAFRFCRNYDGRRATGCAQFPGNGMRATNIRQRHRTTRYRAADARTVTICNRTIRTRRF